MFNCTNMVKSRSAITTLTHFSICHVDSFIVLDTPRAIRKTYHKHTPDTAAIRSEYNTAGKCRVKLHISGMCGNVKVVIGSKIVRYPDPYHAHVISRSVNSVSWNVGTCVSIEYKTTWYSLESAEVSDIQ